MEEANSGFSCFSERLLAAFPGQFEFEMHFRSVWIQRLPRFAIDRHAAEVPFL